MQILALDDNVGFAAGNNLGAGRARGDVLFFLNPDTVVHESAVGVLSEFLMSHPDAGAVGPHVLNPDGSDQASISSFVTLGSLMRHYFPVTALFRADVAKEARVPRTTTDVDILLGCAISMRRKVFERIGGWDESYFLYAEERELCHATREAGFRNYFLPTASIVHIGGASTSREDYAAQQIIQQRSSLASLRRHHGGLMVSANRLMGLVGFGIRAAVFAVMARLTGRPDFEKRKDAARSIFRWFLLTYDTD